MSYNLILFTDPLNAHAVLTHDSGKTIVGTPTTHPSGRPGTSFWIPDDTPNGWGAQVDVTAPGCEPYRQKGILYLRVEGFPYPWDGAQSAACTVDDIRLRPSKSRYDIDTIRVAGDRFVYPDGTRYLMRMMTGFCDYAIWLDQGADALRPLLEQSYRVGARGRRVFLSMQNIRHFDPREYGTRFYDEMPRYFDFNAQHGQFLELECNQDIQLLPGFDARWHFHAVGDVARDRPGLFLSPGNEPAKNGFDPNALGDPGPGLCVGSGSGLGDAEPPRVPWSHYRQWHGRRDWPKVYGSAEDMQYVKLGIEEQGGHWVPVHPTKPCVHNEPIGFATVAEKDRRSNDPNIARAIGYDSLAHGDGVTFHAQNAIFGRTLDGVEEACARAMFETFP